MWVEGNIIGVPYYSPAENPPTVYVNYDDEGGKWVAAEIPESIPKDVIAVHLLGVLIITSGYAIETANFTLRLRRYLGDANAYLPDYVGQVVCVSGGVRSPFAAFVPVQDRKFEYYFARSTPIGYPDHASYGFKLYVDAYIRTAGMSPFI